MAVLTVEKISPEKLFRTARYTITMTSPSVGMIVLRDINARQAAAFKAKIDASGCVYTLVTKGIGI